MQAVWWHMRGKRLSVADTSIACRLCGATASHALHGRVLARHDVSYFLCPSCGLLQSQQPYWLEEAYTEALAAADTGVMQRNLWLMKTTAVLFRLLGMQQGCFLDYGGGHGVFSRLMRDHGFDFRCWDAYAQNLFACGFEGDPGGRYDAVTAFEVLEHLVDPKGFFDEVLGSMQPELLFASSELLEEPVDPAWHYFYFETGQHIAFYQQRTLKTLAEAHGYTCISEGSLHLFMRRPRSMRAVRFALRHASRIYPLLRFPSLVADDHRRLLDAPDRKGEP